MSHSLRANAYCRPLSVLRRNVVKSSGLEGGFKRPFHRDDGSQSWIRVVASNSPHRTYGALFNRGQDVAAPPSAHQSRPFRNQI